jgi:hypothetical protein
VISLNYHAILDHQASQTAAGQAHIVDEAVVYAIGRLRADAQLTINGGQRIHFNVRNDGRAVWRAQRQVAIDGGEGVKPHWVEGYVRARIDDQIAFDVHKLNKPQAHGVIRAGGARVVPRRNGVDVNLGGREVEGWGWV